jgi:hypothetical protein
MKNMTQTYVNQTLSFPISRSESNSYTKSRFKHYNQTNPSLKNKKPNQKLKSLTISRSQKPQLHQSKLHHFHHKNKKQNHPTCKQYQINEQTNSRQELAYSPSDLPRIHSFNKQTREQSGTKNWISEIKLCVLHEIVPNREVAKKKRRGVGVGGSERRWEQERANRDAS